MRPQLPSSIPPPRRQSPPKDRSAVFAALIIVGLLLAVLLGWTAHSMRNRPSASKSSPKATTQDKLTLGATSIAAKAAVNSPQSVPAKVDGKKVREGHIEPVQVEPGDKPRSSAGPMSSNLNAVETGNLEQDPKNALPKLSDLDSYKNNPIRTRVKSTWPKDKKTTKPKSVAGKRSQPQGALGLQQPRPGESIKSTTTEGKEFKQINPFALAQSTSDIVFYQELVVDRHQQFLMEGVPAMNQKSKYRVASRISIHPGDSSGFRKVTQTIVSANLIAADSKSKKSLVESLKNLLGKEFQFSLDREQKVMLFKGEKEKPKAIDLKDLLSVEGFTGEGFMVASVMDRDGWREMAQLCFLLPDGERKQWTDQMEHDWGELGSWTGETQYEKKGEANGLLRIDYAHRMRYRPGTGKDSTLPFTIEETAFESSEAGGRILFDPGKNRITRLIERFQVSGELAVNLLGSRVKLKMHEIQTFELQLHDQNPQ
ncbi:MAG: hypothetical protein VX438_05925 [Planctomycetota bacterium]|nr:hypothetical protein [Planctomycetota bacterium]